MRPRSHLRASPGAFAQALHFPAGELDAVGRLAAGQAELMGEVEDCVEHLTVAASVADSGSGASVAPAGPAVTGGSGDLFIGEHAAGRSMGFVETAPKSLGMRLVAGEAEPPTVSGP